MRGKRFEDGSIVTLLIRILRALEADQVVKDPTLSESRKNQKLEQKRRAEVQYLRFLRTKERPENYNTIKIIGKGAFGEVKLVQKKTDGRIYALKSLVKSEMVRISRNDSRAIFANTVVVQEGSTCSCAVGT
jgi:serine/threonine protein kinase